MTADFSQPTEFPGDIHPPRQSDLETESATFQSSPDPLTTEVLAQLAQPPEQKTWMQTLALLAFSLMVFSGMGLLSYSLPDLSLLVGVLLFHELGHYLGMRFFNYQDVRMFFIPLFGAAVSGRPTSVAGYKEAVVILLGPLPGILLGLILGAACLHYDDELLRTAAGMLLIINGFNLLPFLPLDGGRLLHLALFSRQRHLEAMFRFVTGVLLALCGWGLSSWVLGVLGALMALSTGHTFRVSTLAQQLRRPRDPAAELNLSAQIPPEQALPLVTAVREAFPKNNQSKALVNTARQVWERIHVEPPGVLASVTLLGVYFGALLITPLIVVLFQMPHRDVVARPQADGSIAQVEEVRVWGQLRASTELNADGHYHGRHVEFTHQAGQVAVEGSFFDGLPDGIWKYYDPNGLEQGTMLYDRGQLVEIHGQIPGLPPEKNAP